MPDKIGLQDFGMLKGIAEYLGGLTFDKIVDFVVLGAICQVLLWLWLHILGKDVNIPKNRRWCFWLVGFLCFSLLASFIISAGKYFTTQLNEIRKEVSKTNAPIVIPPATMPPAIKVSVFRCSLGPVVPNGFLVCFNLRLANPGMASTAWDWMLKMTLLGKQIYEYPALDAEQLQWPLIVKSGDSDQSITKDDYLMERLLRNSISPEHGEFGWMMFVITNVPLSEVNKTGTKFTLEFEQADGTKRSADYIWTEVKIKP